MALAFLLASVELITTVLLAGWCCLSISLGVWSPTRWALVALGVVTVLLFIAGAVMLSIATALGPPPTMLGIVLAFTLPGAPSIGFGMAARQIARRL